MTRPIKFRGKRLDNGEWVYGSYVYDVNMETFKPEHIIYGIEETKISDQEGNIYPLIVRRNDLIDPTTLGQYVEIENGSGDGLYEGDLVRFRSDGCYNKPNLDDLIGELTLSGSKWVLRTEYGDYDIEDETDEFYAYSTIIGNIHDKQ